MKAIVMETRENEAAVLLKNGTFCVIKGKYTVGETIEYHEKSHAVIRKWMAVAAMLILMLGIGSGFWYDINYVAYGEISLDVNPSITYTINKRSRILEIKAVNSDAIRIVDSLEKEGVQFIPVSDAIERTLSLLETEGYLDTDNEDYILVNVSTDNTRLQTDWTSAVQSGMSRTMEHNPTMEFRIDHSDRSTARKAAENGMSAGRYTAWEQSRDGTKPEEYAEKPIRDIIGGKALRTQGASGSVSEHLGTEINQRPDLEENISVGSNEEDKQQQHGVPKGTLPDGNEIPNESKDSPKQYENKKTESPAVRPLPEGTPEKRKERLEEKGVSTTSEKKDIAKTQTDLTMEGELENSIIEQGK